MNLKQASQATGVGIRKLLDLIHAGTLPAVKQGRDWIVSEADLREALGMPNMMIEVNLLEMRLTALEHWRQAVEPRLASLTQLEAENRQLRHEKPLRITRNYLAHWLADEAGGHGPKYGTVKRWEVPNDIKSDAHAAKTAVLVWYFTVFLPQVGSGGRPTRALQECSDPACPCHVLLPQYQGT